MTMSSTSTKPAKGLRLTQDARDRVRKAFQDPLVKQAEVERDAKLTEWAKKLPAVIFSPAELAAIETLKKGGYVTAVTERWLSSVEEKDDGTPAMSAHCFFGDSVLNIPNSSIKYKVPAAVLKEHTAIFEAYNDQLNEIQGLVKELNSVLLTAKTRPELAALWPGAETLMGEAWIWAKAEPNTLPTVQTTNITAALEKIKKAA